MDTSISLAKQPVSTQTAGSIPKRSKRQWDWHSTPRWYPCAWTPCCTVDRQRRASVSPSDVECHWQFISAERRSLHKRGSFTR